MKIGVHYHPEQWPRETWERDFDNMAALGLQIVHMGAHAWHALEPGPQDFRLDWLAECVDMAAQRQMSVILCTPTASPPVWFADRHPRAVPVDETGQRLRPGGHFHYTPTSVEFQEAAWRITTALGERFGHHASVMGWQIGSTESAHCFDQSDQTHRAFRKWLMRRHGSIDELNLAWGGPFTNATFQDFDQIYMPSRRYGNGENPHACLDGSRFWSWALAEFIRLQVDALKFKIDWPRQFITAGFQPLQVHLNPADLAGDLSFFSWDSFPSRDDPFFKGTLTDIALAHDTVRAGAGRFGLTALQAGAVDYMRAPRPPNSGAIRLCLWTAFAHGAEFALATPYRQARAGPHQLHTGLFASDGLTLLDGGREAAQTVEEIAQLDHAILTQANAASPAVGLYLDFEQLWYGMSFPLPHRPIFSAWRRWYSAIAKLGLAVRILSPGQEWPRDLAMVVVPTTPMVDAPLTDQMVGYAGAGGRLLLTARTGIADSTGQLFDGPWAMPLRPLIGAHIVAYDCLPDDALGIVEMDATQHRYLGWAERLIPDSNTRVLATYAETQARGMLASTGFAGEAAIIQAPFNAGAVTYCGVNSDTIAPKLLEKIMGHEWPVAATSSQARVAHLGGYRIFLNYRNKPEDAPAPDHAQFIVGSRGVPACGVAVWTES